MSHFPFAAHASATIADLRNSNFTCLQVCYVLHALDRSSRYNFFAIEDLARQIEGSKKGKLN